MNTPQSDRTPYWSESAPFPRFAALSEDADTDVLVVGGGITGLTTASILAAAGKRVTLLERHRCASIDTGHTTAHLTMVTDTRLTELVEQFGLSHAQAVWDAGLAAIAHIEETVREHAIEAGFSRVDGYLHSPIDAPDAQDGDLAEDARLARQMGFDAEYVASAPYVGRPAVRFGNQGRIHPGKYLAALAKAIVAAGGRIYEHSEADQFTDEPRSAKANGHTITCGDIVVATHNPLVGLSGIPSATLFQTKLALYTSYVVAGRITAGTIPDALWWDTADPYNYVRVDPHPGYDVVIFGGEDHKTGQQDDTAAVSRRLERRLRRWAPGIELTHAWSGQVIETPDGLPYIGRSADHQYSATGYAGNGMTFGTLAGMMISDAILNRSNPWTELFDPGRKALTRGAWDYVKENVDYPYYVMRSRLTAARTQSIDDVGRGEGKVIELHGSKVAAYRDLDGVVALRSATCTHMGCIVGWNTVESTWDCPCHGSRFKPSGEVISGPAEAPLSAVD